MNNTLTHEQHLKQVDHQIGVIDRRFERSEFRTNQRFDIVEDRLDRHDNQFLELKSSVDELAIVTKEEFDRVYERFDRLESRFDGLEGRFDKLEALVKKGFERTDRLEMLVKKGFGMT